MGEDWASMTERRVIIFRDWRGLYGGEAEYARHKYRGHRFGMVVPVRLVLYREAGPLSRDKLGVGIRACGVVWRQKIHGTPLSRPFP